MIWDRRACGISSSPQPMESPRSQSGCESSSWKCQREWGKGLVRKGHELSSRLGPTSYRLRREEVEVDGPFLCVLRHINSCNFIQHNWPLRGDSLLELYRQMVSRVVRENMKSDKLNFSPPPQNKVDLVPPSSLDASCKSIQNEQRSDNDSPSAAAASRSRWVPRKLAADGKPWRGRNN